MKTPEDILDSWIKNNPMSYKILINAMEEYSEQFKPKWIQINSIEDLPDSQGTYFTYCTTDYSPFYRIDVFCGRLSNAVHHTTGKPIFSHYATIIFPSAP